MRHGRTTLRTTTWWWILGILLVVVSLSRKNALRGSTMTLAFVLRTETPARTIAMARTTTTSQQLHTTLFYSSPSDPSMPQNNNNNNNNNNDNNNNNINANVQKARRRDRSASASRRRKHSFDDDSNKNKNNVKSNHYNNNHYKHSNNNNKHNKHNNYSNKHDKIDISKAKQSVNLIDVMEVASAGGRLVLQGFSRRSPDRATVCCPFHDDSSPSLSLTPEYFHCFGCGASGDVFAIVRECYPQLTFGTALRRIDNGTLLEHLVQLNQQDADGNPYSNSNNNNNRTSAFFRAPRSTHPDDTRTRSRRDRLYLAQVAAGAHFQSQLTRPAAGAVRYYVARQRHLTAATVQRWSLGWAPDAYFGSTTTTTTANRQQQVSLVQHLHELGFDAVEMVEAGLAVPTQRARQALAQRQSSSLDNNETNVTLLDVVTIDNIMDRFRGRLMIPIQDQDGHCVLGFGGREVPSATTSSPASSNVTTGNDRKTNNHSTFKAPKYLNSPESPIFTKRQLLFGVHNVRAMDQVLEAERVKQRRKDRLEYQRQLEAYEQEQLKLEQRLAKLQLEAEEEATQEGKEAVMDSFTDDNIVTNNLTSVEHDDENQQEEITIEDEILAAMSKSPPRPKSSKAFAPDPLIVVEGYMDVIALDSIGISSAVATMGTSVSAEQIEAALQLAEERKTSLVWCLDQDEPGQGAIDRLCRNGLLVNGTRNHPVVTVTVATPSGNHKDPGEFIDERLVAGKARHEIAREFRAAYLQSPTGWKDWYLKRLLRPPPLNDKSDWPKTAVRPLAEFLASVDAPTDLTHRAATQLAEAWNRTEARCRLEADLTVLAQRLKKGNRRGSDYTGDSGDRHNVSALVVASDADGGASWDHTWDRPRMPRGRGYVQQRQPQRDLTPHFKGIFIEDKLDRQWLGLEGKRNRPDALSLKPDDTPRRKRSNDYLKDELALQRKTVYFNSNEYHGSKFLTDEAVAAGYSRDDIQPDPETLAKYGVGALVKIDKRKKLLAAEDRLLRVLVECTPSRATVRAELETRQAIHRTDAGPDPITWTNPAREWLFQTLVFNSTVAQMDGSLPDQKLKLMGLDSMPAGALSLSSMATAITTDTDDPEEQVPVHMHHPSGSVDSFFSPIFAPRQGRSAVFTARIALCEVLGLHAELRMEQCHHEMLQVPPEDQGPFWERWTEITDEISSLKETAKRLKGELHRLGYNSEEEARQIDHFEAFMKEQMAEILGDDSDDNDEGKDVVAEMDREWAEWIDVWEKGIEPDENGERVTAYKEQIVSVISGTRELLLEDDDERPRESVEEFDERMDREWGYWLEQEAEY